MIQRENALIFAVCVTAILIVAGFLRVPFPETPWNEATFRVIVVALTPLLPMAMVVLRVLIRRSLNRTLAIFCGIVVLLVGLASSLVVAAFSGGNVVLLHGAGMTLSVVGAVAVLVNWRFGLWVLASPALIGLWSLVAGASAYQQAQAMAWERPYCVSAHGPEHDRVQALSDLRGLTFYTTRSGYRIADSWYFHRVLLIEGDGDLDVFNWSPRAMRFDPVDQPHVFFDRLAASCMPRKDFLQNLPLIRW